MEHILYEPDSSAPQPRPCSSPHSAPVAWLEHDPRTEPSASIEAAPRPGDAPEPLGAEQQRQGEIAAFLDAYERISPAGQRRDGWTPFLRKLFLQVIADTGRLTLACEYTGLTRQSAYALATRDPLFAAGWDAAAMFARRPVNDTMTEQALEGITETITRPDGVVVTRHRFDIRLSIALLNRLDKRCDRAEERGDKHLAAMRNWDEWLDLIGKGDDQAAQAILDGAQECQNCQLPENANPTPIHNPPGWDIWENVWRDVDGKWLTTFPPPPGFDGYENRPYDGSNYYERACTSDETDLLDDNEAAAEAEEREEITTMAEAERDSFFAALRRPGEERPVLETPPPLPPSDEPRVGASEGEPC
jgi:hypothetical protein